MSIPMGSTIGLLGGGQLARMTAMAARSLGYGVAILDPDARCAASGLADWQVVAPFEDADAAGQLAERCAVVSYEIERVPEAALRAVAARTALRPSVEVLVAIQDRALQKRRLVERGFPVGAYRLAKTAAEAQAALEDLGGACRLKASRGGYDGRGQARAEDAAEASRAFAALGAPECVVEREIELAAELSVLVARRPSGETALHPVSRNWHRTGVLELSQLPGELPREVVRRATEMGRAIADDLEVEGLLTVELFLTNAGELLVNELAPRPHNTFHSADTACATSQFEQYVRAICDLPLGSTEIVRPTALANLIGDLWSRPKAPRFERALALGNVKLHLYGKTPRRGRKVGHLLATAATPGEALARVDAARRVL
jgi:5-(carboxyamino)imidazole ribonucleotide synthase